MHLWRKIFPHSRASQAAWFSKKNRFFLKSAIYFISGNNHILAKVCKKKLNVFVKTFLDFANVSNYLKSIFAWKRSCTISFELQMPQISLAPLWQVLQSCTKGKEHFNHPTTVIIFTTRWIFWQFLFLKSCNFSVTA